MRALPLLYLGAAYAFIYLPVAVLVVFSFQSGGLPVPRHVWVCAWDPCS